MSYTFAMQQTGIIELIKRVTRKEGKRRTQQSDHLVDHMIFLKRQYQIRHVSDESQKCIEYMGHQSFTRLITQDLEKKFAEQISALKYFDKPQMAYR